jgi:hypothetical protein
MRNNKEIYIIISNSTNPSLRFGEAIRESTYAATNFRKAYDMALILGRIKEPRVGYRAALERVTSEFAVQLEDKLAQLKVTIVRVKKI